MTPRVYYDSDGRECSLDALCMREPAWAANRIRAISAAVAKAVAAERERGDEALRAAKDTIDKDRSGMAHALGRIVGAVRERAWLLEGRGPYEWDDDRYKDQAGEAMREVTAIATEALSASGTLADKAWRDVDNALRARATAAEPVREADALDRESLGQIVREVWIAWAREQPSPKASWLVTWEGLTEPDREVDRRIGETVAARAIAAARKDGA